VGCGHSRILIDPGPFETVLLVVRALDAVGAPYFVAGSLASSAYGFPRATNDADLIVDLAEPQVDALVAALSSEFVVDAGMALAAIHKRSSFNIIRRSTVEKVDLFVGRELPWQQEEMARRRQVTLTPRDPAEVVYFASAEDTVLSKLAWYRLGREVSERQWADVLAILRVQAAELDLAYLERWAAERGVTDLLDRALRESKDT